MFGVVRYLPGSRNFDMPRSYIEEPRTDYKTPLVMPFEYRNNDHCGGKNGLRRVACELAGQRFPMPNDAGKGFNFF